MLRPVFHDHVTVSIIDPDRILLSFEDEGEERALTGSCCGLVAELIDGIRTVDDILERLESRARPEIVFFALHRLEAGGYIGESDAELSRPESAFWAALGLNPQIATKALRDATVSITALGRTDGSELSGALARCNIGIAEDAAFRVVLTDDYLNRDLRAINREALETEDALDARQNDRHDAMDRTCLPPRRNGMLAVLGPSAQ